MENEKVKVTRFINVGILDIRKAAGKELGRVEMVNVGYILHTPGSLEMPQGGRRVNVGQFVEASPEARLLLSPTTLTDEYFSQREAPLELLAFSPVRIDAGMTPEAIDKGLARLDIYGGPLICPRHLLGALQAKIQHQDGGTVVYDSPNARFVMGKLVLDESYLDSLEDGAEVIVVGALKLPEVLSNDLLRQKIGRLFVLGKITCHEENVAWIRSTLSDDQHRIKVIPAGYTLVEKPLELNDLALEALGGDKVYCTEWVQIDREVSEAALDANLGALIAEERVYCPVGLKEVILRKVDWLKTRLELYAGDLWVIEDARELPGYAFEHLADHATLVVFGELTLDPEISTETLLEKLDKVHNMGSISCTPAQMGAIQSLLGVNEGQLNDSTKKPPQEHAPEPEGDVIKESYINASYVSL